MSLLKTSKLSTRRNTLSLIAACLLLAAPCVTAAAFALQFDIDNHEAALVQQQDQGQEASQKMERAREELERKERELAERVRKNSNPQGEELETLRRMASELREAHVKLSHEQEAQHLKETEKELVQLHERLAQIIKTYPADEARTREVREQLAQLHRSLSENEARLREQLDTFEKHYPNDALMAEQLLSLNRVREEIEQQQDGLTQEKREKIEEKLKLKRRHTEDVKKHYREVLEELEAAGREGEIIRSKEYEKLIRKNLDKHVRKEIEEAGRADHSKEQAELANLATMSMDRAIQIAISQYPGKVLSCSLGRQKDGQPFYRLVIITGEGDKSSAKHVWVSATDGQILKTEHE